MPNNSQSHRHRRFANFDETMLETIKHVPRLMKVELPLTTKLRMAVQLRKSLVASLQDMRKHNDLYDFGPTQLKALDVLIAKTKKAKTERDLHDIYRMTCYLKLEKR